MLVGLIHGSDYTGGYSGISGLYDPQTGEKIHDYTEYKNTPGATFQSLRVYQYQSVGANTFQYIARPRVEQVNGNEIPIDGLMARAKYADGTPIESLKPAVSGADITSENTALNTQNIGDYTALSVQNKVQHLTSTGELNNSKITGLGSLSTQNTVDWTEVDGQDKPADGANKFEIVLNGQYKVNGGIPANLVSYDVLNVGEKTSQQVVDEVKRVNNSYRG